jgi:hypothetical protein
MNTDQLERSTRTDRRSDHGPRDVTRADVPSPRPRIGGALRRLALGVVAVLLTAVIAAGVWFAMTPSVEEPQAQAAPLFDLSIRARDHDALAPGAPQEALLDRSIRAREPAAAVPVSIYDRSIRAHDDATRPDDSLLQQSVRARER